MVVIINYYTSKTRNLIHIQTYFTQEVEVRPIILDLLDSAKSHVHVAVAWFTDRELFSKLIEIQERGVQVELIITSHEFNKQSKNRFNLIEENGGFFAEVGSDEKLMHMKFCVLDFSTVVSGSANWSNRAFSVNNEEVTIVKGHQQRANDFVAEFERLKLISGRIKDLRKDLDISQALKTFEAIKALIAVGETQMIQPLIHRIRHIEELEVVVNLLQQGDYQMAVSEMGKISKKFTQLVDVTSLQREELKVQIRLVSYQIEINEVERSEIEAVLERFNHRYIIELNPLIAVILELKKKVFEKLKKYGTIDSTYADLEDEFRQRNQEYTEELENSIPDLSDEDQKSIKEMHRESVRLCHPDSPNRIFEDKTEAARYFDELTKAYRRNDIEKVKMIWSELKSGAPNANFDPQGELDVLRSKLEALKAKLEIIVNEIHQLKKLDAFLLVSNITDWDEYFIAQKILLQDELDMLNNKYK